MTQGLGRQQGMPAAADMKEDSQEVTRETSWARGPQLGAGSWQAAAVQKDLLPVAEHAGAVPAATGCAVAAAEHRMALAVQS